MRSFINDESFCADRPFLFIQAQVSDVMPSFFARFKTLRVLDGAIRAKTAKNKGAEVIFKIASADFYSGGRP